MSDKKELNNIIRIIKELFIKSKNNRQELSKLIDKYLIPSINEKKKSAEISTPYMLRQQMLDKIPKKFWEKECKIFEPCSGKGGFLIDIVDRLMIGLKNKYPDEKERYKQIINNYLYFCDINPLNIFINKLLLDPDNCYNLNYHEGNTLELDIEKKWNINGFDAVIGNPPYNSNSGNSGKGHLLWDKFVEYAIFDWLCNKGFLLFVTPSLWRQINHIMFKLMKQCKIHYLEIHDEKDGKKMFNCATRYDWYLLQNTTEKTQTCIIDQKGNEIKRDISYMNFIPNFNIEIIENLTNKEKKIEIMYERSAYGTEKKWISKTKDSVFKYPVVYMINEKDEIKFRYSSTKDKGMFGIPKVIYGGGVGSIIDDEGKYALTEFCSGIVDEKKNLSKIKKILESQYFKNEIKKAIMVGKSELNTKILREFNFDFWDNLENKI